MWTSGHGCVPVTPYIGNWMRGLVRPRHSSTAVASLLTHLCMSSPSPAPPRVSLGTPRFSHYHLFLLLTAPAAPHPWLAFPFIPALPHAILTALYTLVTLMKSCDSYGQSYAGAFNQRAAVLSVLARIPGEEAPVLDMCLPTEPHGIQSPPAVGRAEGGTWSPGHSLSRCGLLLGIG